MPWVKFSDDWYDDGKLAGADPAVLAMWAVGISWSARNLTDGEIPMGEHRRLVNLYGTFDSEGTTPQSGSSGSSPRRMAPRRSMVWRPSNASLP